LRFPERHAPRGCIPWGLSLAASALGHATPRAAPSAEERLQALEVALAALAVAVAAVPSQNAR